MGKHDAVGAGLNELALRGGRFAARDDRQTAVQAARAERNEDVGRVIRQDCRQRPRPRNPGAAKNVLVRGVALQAQETQIARGGHAAVAALDDHEVGLSRLKLARQHLADAAVAANDDVIGEVLDFLLHAAGPKKLLELAGGDELNERAGQEDHARAAGDDQRDGDGAQFRGVDRPHFVVADRVDSQHDHVERVAEVPSVMNIGRGRAGRDHEHESKAGSQIAKRGG